MEGDDDEGDEGHDRQGWEWPESTPATRRALRCARDGAMRWIWWLNSPGGGEERKRETLGVVWTRRGDKRGARATGGARRRRGRGHVRARRELDEKVRGGCAVARGWLVGSRVTRGRTGSWVASRLGEKRRGRERAGWLRWLGWRAPLAGLAGGPGGAAALAAAAASFLFF